MGRAHEGIQSYYLLSHVEFQRALKVEGLGFQEKPQLIIWFQYCNDISQLEWSRITQVSYWVSLFPIRRRRSSGSRIHHQIFAFKHHNLCVGSLSCCQPSNNTHSQEYELYHICITSTIAIEVRVCNFLCMSIIDLHL